MLSQALKRRLCLGGSWPLASIVLWRAEQASTRRDSARKATVRCLPAGLALHSGFPLSGGDSDALQTPSGDVPLLS